MRAVKQLLETAIVATGSPLAEIKQVSLGDPINIPEVLLPAITITPVQEAYTQRGTRYDQKDCTIDLKIIFNQKSYYNTNPNAYKTISGAVYDHSTETVEFTTLTAHGLALGNSVKVTGITPDDFNGVYLVVAIDTATQFTVSRAYDTTPTYVSGGTAIKGGDDEVAIIVKSMRMAGKPDATNSQKTAENTVCGVIQRNVCLPYNDGTGTKNTAVLATVNTVLYELKSGQRGFPTFEVTIRMTATLIADRK